jgi:hypothetical protein
MNDDRAPSDQQFRLAALTNSMAGSAVLTRTLDHTAAQIRKIAEGIDPDGDAAVDLADNLRRTKQVLLQHLRWSDALLAIADHATEMGMTPPPAFDLIRKRNELVRDALRFAEEEGL